MDHNYWEERLQGYIDNELGPADTVAMESHIAECEDCASNLEYFQCMKSRLQAHASTIELPQSVEVRLRKQFEAKRKRTYIQPKFIGMGMAMAAALLVGFLLPGLWQEPYRFVVGDMFGTLVCHDCTVATRAGLKMGELCEAEEHRMGIKTESGDLFRFASNPDPEVRDYVGEMELYGKKVRVIGQVLKPERMIRVESLSVIEESAILKLPPVGAPAR